MVNACKCSTIGRSSCENGSVWPNVGSTFTPAMNGGSWVNGMLIFKFFDIAVEFFGILIIGKLTTGKPATLLPVFILIDLLTPRITDINTDSASAVGLYFIWYTTGAMNTPFIVKNTTVCILTTGAKNDTTAVQIIGKGILVIPDGLGTNSPIFQY